MKLLILNKCGALPCSILFALTATQAMADIKPDSGDYAALPAGTDLALLYQQNLRIDKSYSGGKRMADNLDLNLTVEVLRLVHFSEFFDTGYIWDPQIVIPYGHQDFGATGQKNNGIGDITFGATLWTLADMERNRHLGWSMFITAPTGSDKNRGFALSGNRWAADFQVGYVHGLDEHWTWDVIGETEFYQEQRDTGAHRDPLVQLHNHLRYNFTPQTSVALSYRHNWGSRETLDGQTLDTSHNNGTAGFSATTMLGKQWQVMGQYWRDVAVRSGTMIDDSVQFRVAYIY
ncbi:transporter [Pseudomonas sp. JAI120]|uniref:transporter n=1 Tax=Pseudomonas sp. JAI120 TaxID=2723063 RepID=UPI0030EB9586